MEITAGIAVIFGALIGGSISIITTWLQQKSQVNRDLTRIAFEMALKEYETLIDLAKMSAGSKSVAPLESFVIYYIQYLKIAKSKGFKVEDLKKLRELRTDLINFYSS
nr:hypothetical protein [uncultured Flavobacterium sp.]